MLSLQEMHSLKLWLLPKEVEGQLGTPGLSLRDDSTQATMSPELTIAAYP